MQPNKHVIRIPAELLWDYREAPEDPVWRLQRMAEFFPLYGRDRETVMALYENEKKLKLDETTKILIVE
jgi:hypothetical protein